MAADLEFEKNWIEPASNNKIKEENDVLESLSKRFHSIQSIIDKWLKDTVTCAEELTDVEASITIEVVEEITEEKIKVAVIGAGVSGLCALKHMLANKGKFLPTVFERGSQIGGTWVYNDNITDENGLPTHSCLYKNLSANNPKPLLTIPGFPHEDQKKSYISHDGVLKYIEDFSNNYQLKRHVQLNTMVTAVSPLHQQSSQVTWEVTYCNLKDNQTSSQEFDAVLVCNGHYFKPYIPEVTGIETFTGNIIHSRDYRIPDTYGGKIVLVIGASYSGLDISIDIATTAKQVFLSHRNEPLQTTIPQKISEKRSVRDINGNSVFFVDDSEEEVDAIIFCTGYQYDFPFLSSDIVHVQNQRVVPLYKHTVHIKYHNLIFIGIPKRLSYFPQIHEQARAAVAILGGTVALPSEEEMTKDTDEDFRRRVEELGLRKEDAHLMGVGDLQWKFNGDLASLCDMPTLPEVLIHMADDVEHYRTTDFLNFRKRNYFLLNSSSFKAVNGDNV